ncbi:MAG: S8 family serine peptidase [Candidatus Kerfeldbacteria bacterium]|nr:S8 family serine peptidase [Candidatus Kerfeldbacteria bacterium]
MASQKGKTKVIIISCSVALGFAALVLIGAFIFGIIIGFKQNLTSTEKAAVVANLPSIDPTTELTTNSAGLTVVKNVLEIIWQNTATPEQQVIALASVPGATVRGQVTEFYFTEISVPDGSIALALANLAIQPGVAAVTEAYVVEDNYEPLDPDYQDTAKNWWLKQIEAEPAWEINQGDPTMLVAVIDAGFEVDHPDLASVFKTDLGFNYSLRDWNEKPDHGTHVTGIIAMQPNQVGLVGIAPNIKIVPYKIITFAQMADTIRMAANTANVQVISMSQGFNWWNTNQQRAAQGLPAVTTANMQTATQAVDLIMQPAAVYAKQKGVILVHSAGNDAQSAAYNTLNTTDVVTVANTDTVDGLAASSNFGSPVTIGAPGEGIWSTVGGNNWTYLSGTSMATPLVAGTIALIRSANAQLSFADIVNIIQKTGEPSISISLDKRINAWQALLEVTQQYGVKGMVVNKNGDPISGATVQPKGLPEWGSVSDKFGQFTLAAIPRTGPWEITGKYGEDIGTLILTPLPADQWVARDVVLTLKNPAEPQLDAVNLGFHGQAISQCSYQDSGFQPGDDFFALGCDATGLCTQTTSLDIRFDGPITFAMPSSLDGAFTGELSEYWKQNYRDGELDNITFSGSATQLAKNEHIILDVIGVQHTYTKDIDIHAVVTGTIVNISNQNDLHYSYTIRVDSFIIDPFKIKVQNPHYQTQTATCTYTFDPSTDPLYISPTDGYFHISADYTLGTITNYDALEGLAN